MKNTKKERQLTKRGADELRKKVANIVENHAKDSMELCWAVYETESAVVSMGGKTKFVWEAWGYKTWKDFVGKEMGLHPTTAFTYKRVWQIFYVELQGAWNPNNLQGITKMRILTAANLTKKNVNSWLLKASKMTCAKLMTEVYGTEEIKHLTLSFTKGQFNSVKRNLRSARDSFDKGEEMPRGEIFARIIEEWSALMKKGGKSKLRLVG